MRYVYVNALVFSKERPSLDMNGFFQAGNADSTFSYFIFCSLNRSLMENVFRKELYISSQRLLASADALNFFIFFYLFLSLSFGGYVYGETGAR